MKLLSTEQQTELRALLEEMSAYLDNSETGLKASVNFWALELKPKRVRKKLTDAITTV